MLRSNTLNWVTLVLLVIGGLNWGLIGLFDFNLVSAIFGVMSPLSRLIYVIVGLSALYVIIAAITHVSHHEPQHQPA